jgi:hypothetical protein
VTASWLVGQLSPVAPSRGRLSRTRDGDSVSLRLRIKLQGLLNGVDEIRDRYGDAGLARVLAECSAPVREHARSGIAIEGHPRAEFDDFLAACEHVHGSGDGRIAAAVGARGARQNTRGWVKPTLLFLLNPQWVLQKAASTWHRFNDAGSMRLVELDNGRCSIEVAEVPDPNPLFCAALSGWAEVMCERVGFKNVGIDHPICRARGQARCVWHASWTPK